MTTITMYDATGKITQNYNYPDGIEMPLSNVKWVNGMYNSNDFFIKNNIATKRPTNPATLNKATITADNTDTATISNIPTDCKVTVNGATYTVTDGVFEITSASPGVIKIDLDLFPYLQKIFEVTAG